MEPADPPMERVREYNYEVRLIHRRPVIPLFRYAGTGPPRRVTAAGAVRRIAAIVCENPTLSRKRSCVNAAERHVRTPRGMECSDAEPGDRDASELGIRSRTGISTRTARTWDRRWSAKDSCRCRRRSEEHTSELQSLR